MIGTQTCRKLKKYLLDRVRRARPDLPILDATSELNSANFLSGNISGGLQTTESKIIKNPEIWNLLIVSRNQGLNGFTIWSLFFEISRICQASWTTDCAQIQAQCRIRADGIRREQFRCFRLHSPIPLIPSQSKTVVLLRFHPHRA